MYKIGSKLKYYRTANGYSIVEVVKKFSEINVPIRAKTIYKWENDSCLPDLKTINILSQIYGTNLTSIYEDNKFCKTLNKQENEFIDCLRKNASYRKIIKLLCNLNMEDQ